jgi:hypothetical protein
MKILFFVSLLSFTSCVVDKQTKIISIRNSCSLDVVILLSSDSTITDKRLYYGSSYFIKKDTTEDIWSLAKLVPPFFVFVFNQDVFLKNQRRHQVEGIVKESFLTRYYITSNDALQTLLCK